MNDIHNQIIDTLNDRRIHQLLLLKNRDERDRAGLFLIDGIRPVLQAIDRQASFESLIVSSDLLSSVPAQRAVRQLCRQGVPILYVSPEIYRGLSNAEEPQGIGAVVRQRWEPLHGVRPSRGLCWVAVESVRFPGNLGTIIRTSEAVGGAGLILIGESADPYDSSTVRASMGALFNQRFVRTTQQEFAEWKRRRQCTLVGTSITAQKIYCEVAYPRPTILLLGSEKKGLSDPMQSLCDVNVKIPMVGRSDSLNVGVAAGIMLYELFNQHHKLKLAPTSAI
jgi:TrmH family RNA methyltransferase